MFPTCPTLVSGIKALWFNIDDDGDEADDHDNDNDDDPSH